MKNTFGNSVTITVFGESHGPEIGAVLDGMAAGIEIDENYISAELAKRRPAGKISTARVEKDEYRIVSGVHDGKTTGAPITILIPNRNVRSADYNNILSLPRPGHADYAASHKYHGFEDKRGGGHFSGRITAAIVAAGAIARLALENKGIFIGSHIQKLHGISDVPFSSDLQGDIEKLNSLAFPVLSEDAAKAMQKEIESAAALGDSVGGVLECALTGLDGGIGEPMFDSLESALAHAAFSIPGVKGIDFGLGFGFADAFGSEANDGFRVNNGKIETITNNNGGINGGISNGAPIIFRLAVKPTPSISKPQNTVNPQTLENAEIEIKGRHDPAIIHRLRAVADSMTALVVCDMLALRFGTDYLA